MANPAVDPSFAKCQPAEGDAEYLKIAKQFIMYFYNVQGALDRRDAPEIKHNPEVQKMNQMANEAFKNVYKDDSAKTFEGQEILGKGNIFDHFDKKLTFKTIKYAVTTIDAQPGPPPYSTILVMVTGQLKCDEDRPLPFSHTFFLNCNMIDLPNGTKQPEVTIQSEMFRIGVHDFAAA